jgi:AraC-like DNA-binding protein
VDFSAAQGSVHAFCPAAIVQAVRARGVDGAALARDSGIDPQWLQNPGERISMRSYLRLYQLAEQHTGDPDLGLAVGHITYFMGMNLHLYMTTISRTLKEYLNVIPSTIRLRGDQGRVLIKAEGDRIRMEWHPLVEATKSWRCLNDEMLLSSTRIVTSICVQPVPVLGAQFSYAKPADTRALENAFGSELGFGHPVCCVYFPRESLQYALIDPGFELGSEFRAGPEALFDASDNNADEFLRSLRSEMRRALPGGRLTVDSLSQALGVSRRTLQRRLETRDCSFKQLLQSMREELSLRYLDDSRLAISEITLLLGYSDQASFSNAFKGWRGCSPSEYRNLSNRRAH